MSSDNLSMISDGLQPTGQYRPGVCNIGPAEVARRRRSAIVATGVAALVAIGILVTGLPSPARLALFPFAAAAGVSWLQVTRRFCVAFGVAGILNFGSLGMTTGVADAAARAADRRTAMRMGLEGAAYGALVTVAFWIVAGFVLPA